MRLMISTAVSHSTFFIPYPIVIIIKFRNENLVSLHSQFIIMFPFSWMSRIKLEMSCQHSIKSTAMKSVGLLCNVMWSDRYI